MKLKKYFKLTLLLFIVISSSSFAQDVFTLNPGLEGVHPRILFTDAEAKARGTMLAEKMPSEWNDFIDLAKNTTYSNDAQTNWRSASRIGIAYAMSGDEALKQKGASFLNQMLNDEWEWDVSDGIGIDGSHHLAGFALLYDIMYNDLSVETRQACEDTLLTGQEKIFNYMHTNIYWTHDYQYNHIHMRMTALLYCTATLVDKYPETETYANYTTTVWRRLGYVMAPDGSSHEGFGYGNYGAQILFPGIYGLRHLTDLDITTKDFYHNKGYFNMYSLVPDRVGSLSFGDATEDDATPLGSGGAGPNYLAMIASDYQDPYLQYLDNQLRDQFPRAYAQITHWTMLYIDPDLVEQSYSDFPLHKHFDDYGVVICRSSWDDDAIGVAFKCGPMGGKIINDTRNTEYSNFTDYVTVAHDDADAGAFLLFSKGSFLAIGDGYEKVAKLTSQQSTFIVDDLDQYGGGRKWTQPIDVNLYAYEKDFFALNENVVFSGDMKRVYPNMETLDRTFVSHKAKYILIYDNAKGTLGMSHDYTWQLQTKGILNDLDNKTYGISNGTAIALAKLLSPTNIGWSTKTNKIGNILYAKTNSSNQENFLTLIWPNVSNLDGLLKSYNTTNITGVKIANENNHEYTLFQNGVDSTAKVDSLEFRGNTLMLTANASDGEFVDAALVNGYSITYNSTRYFNSDHAMNFSIERTGDFLYSYKSAPSSKSDTSATALVTIGGLIPTTTYFILKEGEATDSTSTNRDGEGIIEIELNKEYIINLEKGITSVHREDKMITEDFSLSQNYPNPFNPETVINFQIPYSSDINISIYNSLGQKINTIVDSRIMAGNYTVTWDGLNQLGHEVSSGIYFYKITVDGGNGFSQTKKMILLR